MTDNRSNVIEAKTKLYSELMNLDHMILSLDDVDLMYVLAKDKDIQKRLQEKIDKKREDEQERLCLIKQFIQ